MTVTVIICTYRRSAFLKKALASVAVQSRRDEHIEVLVVDNNSGDDTEQVVRGAASSSGVTISYLLEEKQGLSHARNAGIDNARGEVLAFIDDDAEVSGGWAEALAGAFEDPAVFAAGGPVKPVWGAPRPAWLSDKWAPYLSFGELKPAGGKDFCPIGTNMAFRRSALGGDIRFPTALGRRGGNLISNEELYLCRELQRRGGAVRYVPDAVVSHYIPPERLTKAWFFRRAFSQGRSDIMMDRPGFPANIYELGLSGGVIGKNFLHALLPGEARRFSARMMVHLFRGRFVETLRNSAA